jgi:spore coat polysaccharide biosynthesis predicted glycosyltransferase SpsG
MRQCDVAISAGGTTLAELAACGVPTVCFSIADNQLNGVNAYGEKGVLAYVGDVRDGKEQLLIAIKKHLDKLLDDKQLRMKYSENGKNTIDGRGAMRIAELFITSYS